MEHSPGFVKLVTEAKKHIKEEDHHATKRRIDSRDKFVLVDTREDSEWARGHLPGAVHMCRGHIERDIEKTVPNKDETIVLYCGGGFRSALAAESLQKMGYRHVISMDGGWRAWTESSYPVIRD
ncbi:MAG: rhodanese-like domain-containing protein [Candidatus Acidiferrales bacterium]